MCTKHMGECCHINTWMCFADNTVVTLHVIYNQRENGWDPFDSQIACTGMFQCTGHFNIDNDEKKKWMGEDRDDSPLLYQIYVITNSCVYSICTFSFIIIIYHITIKCIPTWQSNVWNIHYPMFREFN